MFSARRSHLGQVLALAALPLAGIGCKVAEDAGHANLTTAYTEARAALFQAAKDADASTRTHAMEALATAVGREAGPAFTQALKDTSWSVRFAAAVAIGDTAYAPAKEALLPMAADRKVEPDKRVLCAVIYALYSLQDDTYAGELGPLLRDRDKEVRANVALAMGKMGEPSATGPLQSLLEDELDAGNRLQITESLAMLGDTKSLNVLEAFAQTRFLEDRLAAMAAMARVRSPRAKAILRELLSERDRPDVRVAAAGALAGLGEFNQRGYELCVWAVHDPRHELEEFFGGRGTVSPGEMWSLRRLAARSLGQMKRLETVAMLRELLGSRDGGVRVAAAAAVMRIIDSQQHVTPATAPAQAGGRGRSETDRPGQVKRKRLYSAGAKD